MIIESPTNPLIKETAALGQKKHREASSLLLVEGRHPVAEALQAGCTVERLFHLPDVPLPENVPEGVPIIPVSERAMTKMSTTESPPPILAVVQEPQWELKTLLTQQTHPLLLILDGLQDPGNVGTLIRSAAAFGVDGVLLTASATDPYAPKGIRASAGLVFALPTLRVSEDLETLLGRLPASWQVFLTTSHPTRPSLAYRAADYRQTTALVLGTEGAGLSASVLARPGGQSLTIPTAPQVESLNVAICGSIILAEAAAQRQSPPPSP